MDIHIHGREGADVMDATQQGLQTIADALVKTGLWLGLQRLSQHRWRISVMRAITSP